MALHLVEVSASKLAARIPCASMDEQEILGLVSVSIPLDRAARPRASLAEGKAKKAKSVEPEPESEQPEPEAFDPKRDQGVDVRKIPFTLDAKLVNATLRAAYRRAGRRRAEARISGLASRARASAALPELRLRAARSTDESLRLTPTSSDPYRYTQAGGVTVSFEGQATWRLDRLVFADEEIQIEHLARHRARLDGELTEKVLRALFAWQRALVESQRDDIEPAALLDARLRVLEAALRLDVLTGGWFTAYTERE